MIETKNKNMEEKNKIRKIFLQDISKREQKKRWQWLAIEKKND